MVALARGAQAQEDSRVLVETTHTLQARLDATVKAVRARRAERAPARPRA
jgi:hypothetical protein